MKCFFIIFSIFSLALPVAGQNRQGNNDSLVIRDLSPAAFRAAAKAEADRENQYLRAVNSSSLEFVIAKTETPDCWGRAQAWVGQHASLKIQLATDYIIQTYNPPDDFYQRTQYGYYITKVPSDSTVEISIRCISNDGENSISAKMNAHILAYYIRTGKCMPKFIKQ